MTPRSALNVLQQAADKFLGTLEDHKTLQQAVGILDEVVTKVEQENKRMDEEAAETVAAPEAPQTPQTPVVEPAPEPTPEPVPEPAPGPEEPAPATPDEPAV